MNLKISYFNNIRNFNKYDIPLSTAMWDPKWYTQHIDKNEVINGLKCSPLVFSYKEYSQLKNECQRHCQQVPFYCEFMRKYREHLNKIDFVSLMMWFESVIEKIAKLNNDLKNKDKYQIVLIVHEKPEIHCAERPILQEWFKDNNIVLEEYCL